MIRIDILIMGAPSYTKTFLNKKQAQALFEKHSQSVCCYPLVTVDGYEMPTLKSARQYFNSRKNSKQFWIQTGVHAKSR